MEDKKMKANRMRRISVGKLPSDPLPVADTTIYKYQTIQSFRPDEVKELLTQHFARIRQETQGDQSTKQGGLFLSEDGRRRFSLVRSNFRNVRRSVKTNSPETQKRDQERDRVSFKEDVKVTGREKSDSVCSRDKSDSVGSRDESQVSGDERSPRDIDELSQVAHELEEKDKLIAQLKEQLTRERAIFTDELNRLREKQKRFKMKMQKQQEKLDSLLVLVETRERAVQQLYNPSPSPSPPTPSPLSAPC